MRLPSLLAITLLLTLPHPLLAGDGEACPTYGCEAVLLPMWSGAVVVAGTSRFPADNLEPQPPAEKAELWKDGRLMQTIPISWNWVNYLCCCPVEWYGEYADTLTFPVNPGEHVLVRVSGEGDHCETDVFLRHNLRPLLGTLGSSSIPATIETAAERAECHPDSGRER